MLSDKRDKNSFSRKLTAAWSQLAYLPRTAAMVWKASRWWTVVWFLVILIQGVVPVGFVFLTREIVDQLVSLTGKGTMSLSEPLLFFAVLMAGLLLFQEIASGFMTMLREHQSDLIQDHITSKIHSTSTSIELAFYDAPEYFDRLHRARNESFHRPSKLVENFGGLAQNAVTLVAMAVVLYRFSVWIPIVLFASTIPALHVVLRHAAQRHRFRLDNTSDERHCWYYEWEMTNRNSAAEIRLFQLGFFFKSLYAKIRSRLRQNKLKLHRSQSLAEIGAAFFALVAMAFCFAWIGWRVLNGFVTLGETALFVTAFRQGQQMMRSLLGNVGDIYRNILFLGDLFEFIDLESTLESPASPTKMQLKPTAGIEFREVSFAYPGSEKQVLKDFSLEIPIGKVTAIVGPNGSGKSTLVRLMCRLYDPTKGKVEFDGVNLREYDTDQIRKYISVMVQDPVRYNLSARANIAPGNIAVSDHEISEAAELSGAKNFIETLPAGYETVLGKWFEGGFELSAGQWQKLALARTLSRKSPVVLLDEPTSSMDSWSENEWMKRLKSFSNGKTVVIVTHRFTTAMKADLINVLDKGRIVESGTHDELVLLGGMYAASWHAQNSSR